MKNWSITKKISKEQKGLKTRKILEDRFRELTSRREGRQSLEGVEHLRG